MTSAGSKLTIIQKKDWTLDEKDHLTFSCPKCGKHFFRPVGNNCVNRNGVVRLEFYCTPTTGGCEFMCYLRLYGWRGVA